MAGKKKAAAAKAKPAPVPVESDGDWADGQGVETAVEEVVAKPTGCPECHAKDGELHKAGCSAVPVDPVSETVDERIAAAELRAEAAEEAQREAVNRMQELLKRVASGQVDVNDTLTARANAEISKPKLGSLPSRTQPVDKRKGEAVKTIRLYCVPNRYTILVGEEVVEDGKNAQGRMVKVTSSGPKTWVFNNHRLDVPVAAFEAAVEKGTYEYWGGNEWISAPDLADEIKRNTREGARFMERMYKKSVYANKSGADSELQFAMSIHMELKELGLL